MFTLGFTIGTFLAAFEDVTGRVFFIRIGFAATAVGAFGSAFMPEIISL
jgi:hypothetical protein